VGRRLTRSSELSSEESVVEAQIVGDDHRPGQHPADVRPCLSECGCASDVVVGDAVVLGRANRPLWVDQRGVLVDDAAVGAETHYGHLADPITARVQPSGLEIQRGIERSAGCGARGLPAEVYGLE
jgi:hypothetical protein